MSRRSSSAPASPRDPSEPPPPKAVLGTHCTEGRLDADVWVVGGGFGEGEGRAYRGPWDPRGRVQVPRIVRGRKRDSGVALGGVALGGGILDKEDGDWVVCTDIACCREFSYLLQLFCYLVMTCSSHSDCCLLILPLVYEFRTLMALT